MLSKIGPAEIIVVLFIALLIFGPTKLPKLGKAIGQTSGNFRRSSAAAEKGDEKTKDEEI